MNNLSPITRDLQRIIEAADAQLQHVTPTPFSPTAFSRVKEKISDYIVQLVSESIKVSNRQQTDTVSAAHVERASEYLISTSTRRVFKHIGTVGGIFLGAALSNFLSMATTDVYTPRGTLISASLAIIGSFMVALHVGKD